MSFVNKLKYELFFRIGIAHYHFSHFEVFHEKDLNFYLLFFYDRFGVAGGGVMMAVKVSRNDLSQTKSS